MKSCVFIGGKQIGANCLRLLLKKGIRPKLVIGNMDDTGKDTWHESIIKIAKANDLPTIKNIRVRKDKVIKRIHKVNPEVILCIGGTQMIPTEVLKIPKMGCLNIHPALLPKYRGRFSTVHALFNKEKYIGVSAHWMDEGIDSGPIIFQSKFKVEKDDTAKTVYDKFTKLGTEIFSRFVDYWIKGKKITAKSQDEKKATYYPKGLPNNGEIDWNWDGQKILRFIKAMKFEPFPPPSFKIGDKKMVIVEEKYFKGF